MVLVAGCGGSASAKSTFERHLQKDGLVLYRCCTQLKSPAALHAAARRVDSATADLAAVRPPADARSDYRVILAAFRFTGGLLGRMARDIDRRDRKALLRDGRRFQRGAAFRPFAAAVHDLQRKGYDVGVLGR